MLTLFHLQQNVVPFFRTSERLFLGYSLANIYLFKSKNRNTRKRCEIFFEVNYKNATRRRSGAFTVKFEHISHLFSFIVFLLLTLNRQMFAGSGSFMPIFAEKKFFVISMAVTYMDVPYKYTPNCCFNFTQKLENESILQNY